MGKNKKRHGDDIEMDIQETGADFEGELVETEMPVGSIVNVVFDIVYKEKLWFVHSFVLTSVGTYTENILSRGYDSQARALMELQKKLAEKHIKNMKG